MVLYRKCCSSNCKISWWIKLLSKVLRGASPQSPPPWIRTCIRARACLFKVLCFKKVFWLIFNVKQFFFPNSYLATVTFPNFGVDCAKSFLVSTLPKRSFEVIAPFQNTYLCEAGFSSMMTIKQNIDFDWSTTMTSEYFFQPLFPESQILCVENKHKSLTEWLQLVEIFVIFQYKKNLNMAVYSFFQTFCPLIQWYGSSHESF